MMNKSIQNGLRFGVLITIFNIGYQHFTTGELSWKLLVASVIGGLVGGVVYAVIINLRYKKSKQ